MFRAAVVSSSSVVSPFSGKLEIPVLIDADAQGLNVRVLAVRTNFTQVSLQASFEALRLPPITVIVGRRSYSFDRAAFEQEARKLLLAWPSLRTTARSAKAPR